MPVCNYPVALWRDGSGYTTAALLDLYEDLAVYAESRRAATKELKERIRLNCDFLGNPISYDDYQIPVHDKISSFTVRVRVRPQYTLEKRNFPLNSSYRVTFQCFAGPNLAGDMGLCLLPALGLGFEYYLQDADRLEGLVVDRVADHFKGSTPEELSEYLAPPTMELINLPVVSRRRKGKVPWAQKEAAALPRLSQVGEALTRVNIARYYDKPLNRDQDVEKIMGLLADGNVILLGPHGIGKTTILCGAVSAAERLRKNTAPRFWRTSGNRIIAGMRYLGEWEERCEAIIHELDSIEGVLCLPSLLEIIQVGSGSVQTSLAAYFLHFIRQGNLRLVIEATPEALSSARRRFPEFVTFFKIHPIEPLPRSGNVEIIDRTLRDRATSAQISAQISVEDGATGLLYRYFERFEPYRAMPGPACDFAKRLVELASKSEAHAIDRPFVTAKYQERTGLPGFLLDDTESLTFDTVFDAFTSKVKGQETACRLVAETVIRFKAGMNDPNRPIAVLLFSGPTGVGKTQLVKVLAEYLFGQGDKSRLIRLDMSEYAGPGAADRLMGTFSEEPTPLVQGIRTRPFSVLLLDEIEKAAPEVFDLFMGIFDEGRYTDRFGRLTHFNSSVIIMTSNLGVTHRGAPGFGSDTDEQADFRQAVIEFFRPEFFNRMDAIVPFRGLSAEVVREIARKEIKDYQEREAFRLRNLSLDVSPAILDRLLTLGYNAKLGARPLQRALEEIVTTPIARFLAQDINLRNATLHLDLDADGTVKVSV